MKYFYSVVRFVPDTARGERLNAGVIVADAKSSDFQLRTLKSPRLKAIAPQKLVNSFFDYLHDLRSLADARSNGGREEHAALTLLNDLYEKNQGILQLAPPIPVSAANIDEATQLVARMFLVGYAPHRRTQVAGKATLGKHLRTAFENRGLIHGQDWFDRVLVKGRKSPNETPFDFAVKNGQIVQLTHTWNFALTDIGSLRESIKSVAFGAEEVRKVGAIAIVDGTKATVPPEVAIEAVYSEPKTPEGRKALDEAKWAWDRIGANFLPAAEAPAVAGRAWDLLS